VWQYRRDLQRLIAPATVVDTGAQPAESTGVDIFALPAFASGC
jgi:hypothetical protein